MEQNKKVIHITESELHDIIRESVNIILEGQGWNMFKYGMNNLSNGDKEDVANNVKTMNSDFFKRFPKKDYITDGDFNYRTNRHVHNKTYDYYDKNGLPSDNPNDKPIERNFKGAIGRWAGLKGVEAATKMAHGFNKLADAEAKLPWSPFHKDKIDSMRPFED